MSTLAESNAWAVNCCVKFCETHPPELVSVTRLMRLCTATGMEVESEPAVIVIVALGMTVKVGSGVQTVGVVSEFHVPAQTNPPEVTWTFAVLDEKTGVWVRTTAPLA